MATTQCVNGILKVGDLVISAPDDEYSCLIGRVMQINLPGSSEHDAETANETDDVHVNFLEFEYSLERKWEIGAMLSEYYGRNMNFDECPLDDVIMAPGSLIRINHVDEACITHLLQSGFNAACFCYGTLKEIRGGA
jgi:hypothetical protein